MAHAILSPSSASRWLVCTPSARWERQFPDSAGVAAAEGTLAHALAEVKLRNFLKLMPAPRVKTELKKLRADALYNTDMEGHTEDYVAFVLDRLADLEDPTAFVEEKIDLTDYVPEGFGTVDFAAVGHGVLEIIDLKYGKGVEVSAHENKQMMLYGLGALRHFMLLYPIETVRMTIYQPRLENYSSYEMKADDLLAWGEDVKATAQRAFGGAGEAVAGPHCKFCKARNVCKALAHHHMGLAREAFAEPERISPDYMAEILTKAPEFKTWLTGLQEYALAQAVNEGKQWPGFKLVEGRSVRKYADDGKIMAALQGTGLPVDLWQSPLKPLGITALEKNLGKTDVQKLIGAYIVKPPGAPALVPEWDKRPAISSADAAAAAFAEVPTEE